jgi:hypothetical protein
MSIDYDANHHRAPRLSIWLAVTPALGVLCFLAGIAASLVEPTPTLAVDEVVAMRPVEGSEETQLFTKTPIESLYGVPSKRTENLWKPSKK